MSANTMDAEVGLAKIAASVLRCLVFTARCYQIAIALATHAASSRQVMPVRACQKSPAVQISTSGPSPLKTRKRSLNLSQQLRQVPLNGYPNDLKIDLEIPV